MFVAPFLYLVYVDSTCMLLTFLSTKIIPNTLHFLIYSIDVIDVYGGGMSWFRLVTTIGQEEVTNMS